jgi:hypothetical protein
MDLGEVEADAFLPATTVRAEARAGWRRLERLDFLGVSSIS